MCLGYVFLSESIIISNLLKKYRTEKSKEKNVPPYVIYADRTVIELANHKPNLIENLFNIYGLGKSKIEEYGEDIIKIITEKK